MSTLDAHRGAKLLQNRQRVGHRLVHLGLRLRLGNKGARRMVSVRGRRRLFSTGLTADRRTERLTGSSFSTSGRAAILSRNFW